MKLQHIRDVLAVAKFGSLRAAARHLGMVQPSISRSIQDIERELGAALFERLPRGVRLTPIGKAFVKRASIIDIELQRVRDDVDHLKLLSTGNVTIAFSLASSIALMPATLSPFYQRFPHANLTIVETLFRQIEDEVVDGKIDAYVGPLDPSVQTSASLVSEELFDIEMVIVAGKNHPAMQAKSIEALDSLQWSWLLPGPGSEREKNTAWASPARLDHSKTILHMRSAFQIVLTLASSDFLAIVPRQWLEMPALAELIGPVPAAPRCGSQPVCLVRQRNVPMTPMAEYFCTLVRGLAKTQKKRGKSHSASKKSGSNDSASITWPAFRTDAMGTAASTAGSLRTNVALKA